VIVLPPFADAASPALGPSLMTTACRGRGISATVFYANLLMAAEIGLDLYQRLALAGSGALVGEAIFHEAAFPSTNGEDPNRTVELAFGAKESIAAGNKRDARIDKESVIRCRGATDAILDRMVDEILGHEPAIVGFSSVFEQNLASIALARRVKGAAPEVVTVLGGSNADAPMGAALADLVPELDFVFSGEADFEFPRFCERFIEHGTLPDHRVVSCSVVETLDDAQVPEYHDYYAQLASYVAAGKLPDTLPEWVYFETSRGCWYGARSHCKFCGLNGLDFGFRVKSPDRVLGEIDHLVREYAPRHLAAVDNIMPHEVRREVLPRLADSRLDVEIFYEVKANLAAADLDQFVRAGVGSLQPGIESFSSNVLKNMAKGVSGIHNVWLLRECSSRQILVMWNLLSGVPGETRADYEAMLELLPTITHLQPPNGWGNIRLDRYSPYFSRPADYGIRNVRPYRMYEHLYPRSARVEDIAYHFRGDYATELTTDEKLLARLDAGILEWRRAWEEQTHPPRLVAMHLGPDRMLVEDTRECAVDTYLGLGGSMVRLLGKLERPVLHAAIDDAERGDLQELLRRRLVVEHENRLLHVLTRPNQGVALREERFHQKTLTEDVERASGPVPGPGVRSIVDSQQR
jgi:ribosomal peptide maturation radical SAM protein 1